MPPHLVPCANKYPASPVDPGGPKSISLLTQKPEKCWNKPKCLRVRPCFPENHGSLWGRSRKPAQIPGSCIVGRQSSSKSKRALRFRSILGQLRHRKRDEAGSILLTETPKMCHSLAVILKAPHPGPWCLRF